jgi:chromosome segregation ATPase
MNRKARRALKPKGAKVSGRNETTIQQEYVQLCAQLGEIDIRVQQNKKMIMKLNEDKLKLQNSIEKLGQEYAAYQTAQKSEKKDNAVLPFKTNETSAQPDPQVPSDGANSVPTLVG